ncbi:MAG: hypothetical protein KDC71_02540 [Acidobacteria bacterium]|nr:hypothetical protein [Acidobacteriota bacterium]
MFRLVCIVALCWSALLAQVVPDPADPIRTRAMAKDGFFVSQAYRPVNSLEPGVFENAVSRLQDAGIGATQAQVDIRSGKFGTLLPAEPLIPGRGVGNTLSWSSFGFSKRAPSEGDMAQAAWGAFLEYVQSNQPTFGIDIHELVDGETVTVHDHGRVIQIHAQRRFQGVPVRNSYVNAVINQGNLVLMGIHGWGEIQVSNHPQLNDQDAFSIVETHCNGLNVRGQLQQSELLYVPIEKGNEGNISYGDGLSYQLVWAVYPEFDRFAEYEGLVDAFTGELVAFQETTHYLANGGGTGLPKVVGGQYPVSNDGMAPDGVEVVSPFPFLNVNVGGETMTTSSSGQLPCFTGTWSTALSGPFITMTDDCGPISENSSGLTLDLGTGVNPGDTNCTVAPGASAGNTKSARSAYYEINRLKENARSHLPNNVWLKGNLPVNVNINSTCNATGGPSQLRFYRAGGGCNNTGEIAGVFDHEWGHGMDGADATPGISNPGEGIADIYAALRLNSSCIGRNFRASNCGGYGDPCTNCSGVRDIDFAKRASGNPHDINFIGPACGSGGPAPCGGSVHCEGSVYAESVWDLWKRDLPTIYGMSDKTAQELTTRINFIGSGGVSTWFQCAQGTGGCGAGSGYLNFLAADDDNGDLNDGTPHMQAIFSAFDRHGIACNTPTVTTAGCAGTPTSAPVLSGTAGAGSASLSWTSVSGATSYRVFRTEGVFGCDFGGQFLAEVMGTSYQEDGLLNGHNYYYNVVPMGPNAICYGPASNCATVTPVNSGDLGLSPSISYMFNDGDGDVFVDNCEDVVLNLEVFSLGALANVQITAISTPGYPDTEVLSSLPINLGSTVGDCDLKSTSINIRPDGLNFGDALPVEITLSSTQTGSIVRSFLIEQTESDFSAPQTLTYSFESDAQGWSVVQGTFNRSNSGGGSSGSFYFASSSSTINQCDQIRSPNFTTTATSTLEIHTNFDIEDFDGSWWDRANVSLFEPLTGARTLITPDGGRLYNASGDNGPCSTSFQGGYAGPMTTWASSTWSATALQSSSFAGSIAQIDILYGTDGAVTGTGFHFDEVILTNVQVVVPDTNNAACGFNCGLLAFDVWPAQSVLTFITCQNAVPKTLVAKAQVKGSGKSQP